MLIAASVAQLPPDSRLRRGCNCGVSMYINTTCMFHGFGYISQHRLGYSFTIKWDQFNYPAPPTEKLPSIEHGRSETDYEGERNTL